MASQWQPAPIREHFVEARFDSVLDRRFSFWVDGTECQGVKGFTVEHFLGEPFATVGYGADDGTEVVLTGCEFNLVIVNPAPESGLSASGDYWAESERDDGC